LFVDDVELFEEEFEFGFDFFCDVFSGFCGEVHDLFFEGAEGFFSCFVEELFLGFSLFGFVCCVGFEPFVYLVFQFGWELFGFVYHVLEFGGEVDFGGFAFDEFVEGFRWEG